MMIARRLRVFSIVTVLLLGMARGVFAADTAQDLYNRALKLDEQLKGKSQQQNLSDWKKTVDAYRKVYYNFPSSGYCDNSLFQVGALYAEMGERFHDPLYFRRASSTYQFLIEQYPSSSLIEEAMLEYIRINRSELKNNDDATSMKTRMRKIYPKMAA